MTKEEKRKRQTLLNREWLKRPRIKRGTVIECAEVECHNTFTKLHSMKYCSIQCRSKASRKRFKEHSRDKYLAIFKRFHEKHKERLSEIDRSKKRSDEQKNGENSQQRSGEKITVIG